MTRVSASLAVVGCRKVACKGPYGSLHRHHKRHEAMWFGVWAKKRGAFLLKDGRPRFLAGVQERWRKFVERYYKFLRSDTVVICDKHHAEIHFIYDKIIEKHKQKLGKGLSAYSWAEAEDLMDQLETACMQWLAKRTPGMKPSLLDAKRARRRRQTYPFGKDYKP